MSEDYWDGAIFVFEGTVLTDGSNAGTASLTITPGDGNEFEVLYGFIEHTDAASRFVLAAIRDDGARELARLISNSFANSIQMFPQDGAGGTEVGPARLIVAGIMDLRLEVQSMSVNDTATFVAVLRIRGGVPTTTLAGPTGSTDTKNTDKVF